MATKVNHRSWLLIGSLFAISSVISAREYVPRPKVPKILRVPAGQTVLLKALGKGVQIYSCKARPGDPGKFEWSFKAPEADLTNEHGDRIVKHYTGPTWEANDGSKVVGEKKADAPAPRSGAAPWLLLKAKTNEGTGTFARVTYIQRVDTEGGVAPAAGCDQAHVTTDIRVDYTANYYFYVPQRYGARSTWGDRFRATPRWLRARGVKPRPDPLGATTYRVNR